MKYILLYSMHNNISYVLENLTVIVSIVIAARFELFDLFQRSFYRKTAGSLYNLTTDDVCVCTDLAMDNP